MTINGLLAIFVFICIIFLAIYIRLPTILTTIISGIFTGVAITIGGGDDGDGDVNTQSPRGKLRDLPPIYVTSDPGQILKATDDYFKKPIVVKPIKPENISTVLNGDSSSSLYIADNGKVYPSSLASTVRGKVIRRPLHWGQRKLLLSEIDFLNRYCPPKHNKKDRGGKNSITHVVVYAGAAPGRKTPLLADMFPHIEFHLYDPNPFHESVSKHPRIKINPYYENKPLANNERPDNVDIDGDGDSGDSRKGFFTDAVANTYVVKDVFFISDIRIVPDSHVKGKAEEHVMRDQQLQYDWVKIMKPRASMLKFKMPYPTIGQATHYKYIKGEIVFQCWAPANSAETRLIFEGVPAPVWYDIIAYERAIAYYNNYVRLYDFSNTPWKKFGINIPGTIGEFWGEYSNVRQKGYDFVYEILILYRYHLAIHGGDSMAVAIDDKKSVSTTNSTLHEYVKAINDILIDKGNKFDNYLKQLPRQYNSK